MYRNFESIIKKKNITAYQVAKITGVATSTLTEWKKGSYTPKLDKLIKIADCLGVTLEEIIKDESKSE